MISRLWRTGLKPGRGAAYEAFACEISLPMFRKQDGFLGCVMSRNEAEGLVLTFWRDRDAVAALNKSPTYQETVGQILAADLLTDVQQTSVAQIHIADLEHLLKFCGAVVPKL